MAAAADDDAAAEGQRHGERPARPTCSRRAAMSRCVQPSCHPAPMAPAPANLNLVVPRRRPPSCTRSPAARARRKHDVALRRRRRGGERRCPKSAPPPTRPPTMVPSFAGTCRRRSASSGRSTRRRRSLNGPRCSSSADERPRSAATSYLSSQRVLKEGDLRRIAQGAGETEPTRAPPSHAGNEGPEGDRGRRRAWSSCAARDPTAHAAGVPCVWRRAHAASRRSPGRARYRVRTEPPRAWRAASSTRTRPPPASWAPSRCLCRVAVLPRVRGGSFSSRHATCRDRG